MLGPDAPSLLPPMRHLTLRSLRVFEAAATTGAYSRAGELMGMTQSAVSQQIRQLEDETGTRLFDTQARPIRLTDAGAGLLRHARVILAQIRVAEDALAPPGNGAGATCSRAGWTRNASTASTAPSAA